MMKRVLKNHEIIDSPWCLTNEVTGDSIEPYSIVPAQWYLDNSDTFSVKANTGIWFDSHEEIDLIRDHTENICLIALNFPEFNDGRPYSSAYLLRTRFGFQGELRAIGDVRFDQLEFLYRTGFDSFELRDEGELQRALTNLKRFSSTYQDESYQISSYPGDRPLLDEEQYATG